MNIRIGQGYDVHAFGDGDHVMLGGVRVPHERGVLAHSDGDVVLHALCDAMLGALALGDIGRHFPPSDPRWKGADSRSFVRHCNELLRERGRSEEHTSELQSLMRISYAVFCLKKKKNTINTTRI